MLGVVFNVAKNNKPARSAAINRSSQREDLQLEVDEKIDIFLTGLDKRAVARCKKRRGKILSVLNGTLDEWQDWRWQVKNIVRNSDLLQKLVKLSRVEKMAVKEVEWTRSGGFGRWTESTRRQTVRRVADRQGKNIPW